MCPGEAGELIRRTTASWRDDPDSSVVWTGSHEGRWGLRMSQEVREATTVWFDVGKRTVGIEAYLLPAPPVHDADVYRICLSRNRRSWPVAVNVDRRGDLFIGGRITLSDLTAARLDEAVGAIYELVEISFRPLLRSGFSSREKTS